jgi:hypothetical protein
MGLSEDKGVGMGNFAGSIIPGWCSGTSAVLKKRSVEFSKNKHLREDLYIIAWGISLLVKYPGRTS